LYISNEPLLNGKLIISATGLGCIKKVSLYLLYPGCISVCVRSPHVTPFIIAPIRLNPIKSSPIVFAEKPVNPKNE
jgi:hypothetical protein